MIIKNDEIFIIIDTAREISGITILDNHQIIYHNTFEVKLSHQKSNCIVRELEKALSAMYEKCKITTKNNDIQQSVSNYHNNKDNTQTSKIKHDTSNSYDFSISSRTLQDKVNQHKSLNTTNNNTKNSSQVITHYNHQKITQNKTHNLNICDTYNKLHHNIDHSMNLTNITDLSNVHSQSYIEYKDYPDWSEYNTDNCGDKAPNEHHILSNNTYEGNSQTDDCDQNIDEIKMQYKIYLEQYQISKSISTDVNQWIDIMQAIVNNCAYNKINKNPKQAQSTHNLNTIDEANICKTTITIDNKNTMNEINDIDIKNTLYAAILTHTKLYRTHSLNSQLNQLTAIATTLLTSCNNTPESLNTNDIKTPASTNRTKDFNANQYINESNKYTKNTSEDIIDIANLYHTNQNMNELKTHQLCLTNTNHSNLGAHAENKLTNKDKISTTYTNNKTSYTYNMSQIQTLNLDILSCKTKIKGIIQISNHGSFTGARISSATSQALMLFIKNSLKNFTNSKENSTSPNSPQNFIIQMEDLINFSKKFTITNGEVDILNLHLAAYLYTKYNSLKKSAFINEIAYTYSKYDNKY